MLKIITLACDWCEAEAQIDPETEQLQADGWVLIQPYDEDDGQKDFCSHECVVCYYS